MYNKCKLSILLIITILFFYPEEVLADVLINEIYSYETSGDWIELYSYEDATISGWIIRDSASTKVATIPENISIGPSFASNFYIVEAGDRFNRDKDTIKLLHEDDQNLEDEISYGSEGGVCAALSGGSIGRIDNGNTIERFASHSKGVSNLNMALNSCPVPTFTSTPTKTATASSTSTSTATSTPTKTATAIPTPTKTATASSTSTSTATSTPSDEPSAESIAVNNLETSTPIGVVAGISTKKKTPVLSVLFIVSGIFFLGYGGYLIYNGKKNENN